MANLSTDVRNARANAIETTIGASAKLLIFSGAKPADCASPDPSGLLCTIDLPADWLTPASNGAVSKNGVWSGTASGSGTAQSWRIKDSSGATCHMQGTAGEVGTELILDNADINSGQTVSISSFTWTEGDA